MCHRDYKLTVHVILWYYSLSAQQSLTVSLSFSLSLTRMLALKVHEAYVWSYCIFRCKFSFDENMTKSMKFYQIKTKYEQFHTSDTNHLMNDCMVGNLYQSVNLLKAHLKQTHMSTSISSYISPYVQLAIVGFGLRMIRSTSLYDMFV